MKVRWTGDSFFAHADELVVLFSPSTRSLLPRQQSRTAIPESVRSYNEPHGKLSCLCPASCGELTYWLN